MAPRFIILIMLSLFSVESFCASMLTMSDDIKVMHYPNHFDIGSRVRVLEDAENSYTVSDIRALALEQFLSSAGDALNFGISDSSFWIRFTIAAIPHSYIKERKDLYYLKVKNVFLDKIDFYSYHNSVQQSSFYTGDSRPVSQRPVASNYFVFPVQLSDEYPTEVIVKIVSNGTVSAPLSLWEPAEFHQHHRIESMIMGGYFLALIVMIIYNLFFWISTRLPSYSYYIFFALSMLFLQLGLRGYGIEFIWVDRYFFQSRSVPLLGVLTCIFSILFSRSFLETNKYLPKLDVVMKRSAVLSIVLFPLSVLTSTATASALLVVFALFTCTLALVSGVLSWKAHNELAKYFLLAWTTLLCGAASTALVSAKIFPLNFFTDNLFLMGSAAELVLFSFALAHRISIIEHKAKTTLHIANRELQRSILMKDEFLSSISHELRTPMNGIKGALTLIKDSKSGVDTSQYFEVADRSAEHMVELVDAVLIYSESVSGNLVIKNKDFHLANFLEPCIKEFSMQCREKSLDFDAMISDNCARYFNADADKIKVIIYQLLSNAVKYTTSGSVMFSLTLPTNKKNQIHIAIEDTGEGMSDEQRDYAVCGTKKPEANHRQLNHGIGIGIKLSLYLVKMMGGDISFASSLSSGTKVLVDLPITPVDFEPPVNNLFSGLSPVLSSSTEDSQGSTPIILIVEDNLINQKIMVKMLEKLGFKSLIANNGLEGLHVLAQQQC